MGHARDYIEMQWLCAAKYQMIMLFLLGDKQAREFIEICAKDLGWAKTKDSKAIIWEGSDINEIGKRADTGKVVIKIDPRYFRLTEVDSLLGDSTKAERN